MLPETGQLHHLQFQKSQCSCTCSPATSTLMDSALVVAHMQVSLLTTMYSLMQDCIMLGKDDLNPT